MNLLSFLFYLLLVGRLRTNYLFFNAASIKLKNTLNIINPYSFCPVFLHFLSNDFAACLNISLYNFIEALCTATNGE
jgi:hypothetical protein